MRIDRYQKNTNGKDYVVGDIHGNYFLLKSELQSIGFDFENDRLFSVGDLVDRGPESHMVMKFLDESPWLIPVMGNHEQMAILYDEGLYDKEWYIQSGGSWNVFLPKEETSYIAERFANLPLAIELETNQGFLGIVHANVPTGDWHLFKSMLPKNEQIFSDNALWDRSRINAIQSFGCAREIVNIDAVVFGHTTIDDPIFCKNTAYIDTGACYDGGEFTVIEVEHLMSILCQK